MRALVLIAALLLDRFVGEYPNRWHPVVWMGTSIRALERRAPMVGRALPFGWGLGMALAVPAAWAALGLGVEALAWPLVEGVLAALLLKACLAHQALGAAGLEVAAALEAGDLPRARHGLRSLCSRDPSALGPAELAAGATESLAENASDSVVAPIFWYALLGLPGVTFYRAANTMDAMVGYRGRYEWLGKAPARLDDLLNVVPARLTAVLLVLGGLFTGADVARGLRTGWRDRYATASPNAGWPMATMAGLLGVELNKPGVYTLGAGGAPAEAATIRQAWRIVQVAMAVGALLAVAALAWAGLG